MKKSLLLILAFCCTLFSFSQQDEYETMPYIKGDILVMVDDNDFIQTVVENHRNINGVMTELGVAEVVSEPANIWLLKFNHNNISHVEMLRSLDQDPHVVICQNNHLVTNRAVPNDPNYGAQWHHQNIDSELAWDITTGGTTANGDEIVVCVLEGGGSDYDHPDLLANHWVNTAEQSGTPGVDDDGNGYVDDINGWNVGNGTDNISAGNHGTGVSGMIGAVGNNNSVVVGANWDVKIMQVDMPSGLSESNVINSYTYPLVMRQMYNNSGGAQGAFVVATNASWGIDQGDPASAPLWCAFYDTLGFYGILNFGATANQNWDIDQVGDLPTACGSDYMISVTATNSSDVRTFSGYGQTTIDLGAPGEAVVTTANGGGSTSTSGTSFATPLTAGVCGLMYSVPCSNLAAMALTDPQGAANIVRQAIFDGVDPVANLTTETVTGGRLNAYNSCNIIQIDCPSYNTNCTGNFTGTPTAVTGCNGDCTGQIDMSGSGGSGNFQYSLDGGPFSADSVFTGLCAGNYVVSVDDGVDCQLNIQVTVSEPDNVGATTSVNHISCNGAADGEITVSGTGGTPPYQYSNDGGTTWQSGDTFTGLGSGVHTVWVQDSQGCQYSTIVGVNEPASLSINAFPSDEMFGNDGEINVTMSGGTPPYSYAWTGPNGFNSTLEDISGLEAGIYNLTVTDANGCTVMSGDVVVDSQLGMNENDFEFSVYPNPASDEIIIQADLNGEVTLNLLDGSGKLVLNQNILMNTTVIDISQFSSGIYIMKLTTKDGQVSMKKLVIE